MKKYLSIPEATEMLGITQRAAWQRLYRGQLPQRRWGRRVLIPMAELERFLEQLPGCTTDQAQAASEETDR